MTEPVKTAPPQAAPPAQMAQSPIFAKTHDLLVWLLQHTAKFPKSERFRLAKRVEDSAFRFYDLIARATKSGDKRRSVLLEAWLAHARHGDTWGLRRAVLRQLVIRYVRA